MKHVTVKNRLLDDDDASPKSGCIMGIISCNAVRGTLIGEKVYILSHAIVQGKFFYFDGNTWHMNVIKGAVSNVNGNQIPVIAMDQPLYAKAKLIQWTWPEKYGESKFVFLFGSLHIEQAFMRANWKMAGAQWVENCIGTYWNIRHIKQSRCLY